MLEGLEIRGARRDELTQVAEIAQTIAPVQPAAGIEEVKASAKVVSQDWHVAYLGTNQLIGIAQTEMVGVGRHHLDKEILTVKRLGVAPEYRGQGVGKRLLEHVIRFGEERMVTEVEVRLAQAEQRIDEFLKSAGFVVIRPKLFKRPILSETALEEIASSAARSDGRIPDVLSKKSKFLHDAYPEEEFSDDEMECIFAYMPQILDLYREAFHPRTRNRLNTYADTLARYAGSSEPASQILEGLPFTNPNALHVWLKGFSGSIAKAIKSEDLKIIAASLAALYDNQD